MHERRRSHRTRAFTAATLADGDGGTVDCVVRDLSGGGALLLVDHPRRVPDDLTLDLGEGQGRRRARVAWRGASGVGVAFASAERHNVIQFPLPVRSASPEADRERLARRIARFVPPRDPGSRRP